MKVAIQIYLVLFSVIGLAMMMMNDNCMNNGSKSLHSCQTHPNIVIKKVHVGGKRDEENDSEEGGINRYSLSLRYSQNNWWEPPKEVKWIECKHLCKICESLPGINNSETGESVSQLTAYTRY